MTAHSITTDLTLMDRGTGTYVELNSPYNAGGTPAASDGDYFIEGTSCATQTLSASKSGLIFSMVWDNGSDLAGSFGTDDCYFLWQIFLAGTGIDTWANGGLRVFIGADQDNGEAWQSGGSDFGRNPYGGWQNVAIDPTLTADYTIGTPTAVWRYFGSMPNTIATISKGAFHGIDVSRYGRGELIIEFGTGADADVTFQDIADDNDSINNRWGLFQSQGTSYLWKGLMSFGNATNEVNFTDSNVIIFIDDTPRTYAAFNRIEIKNSSSTVSWTAVSITAPNTSVDGTVLSQGEFEVIDDCTVTLTGCTFTDMSTFTLLPNTAADGCIFRRCGQIDTGASASPQKTSGADLSNSTVDAYKGTANTSAVLWTNTADPDGSLDNMTFIMAATLTHAIEFGVDSPTTMTLRGCDFQGYGDTDNANNSHFHFKRTTGSITLNLVGCSSDATGGAFSYRTDGATILLVEDPVTLTVNTVLGDGTAIGTVRVHVVAAAASPSGALPVDASVTITRAGSPVTASVSHTGHGLSNGQKVLIEGANEWQYNGVKTLTNVTVNAYDYLLASDPGGNATGTITSTAVIIDGDSNGSGVIADTRTYSLDQPYTGWARKMSGAPYYKEAPLNGVIDKTLGETTNGVLTSDE